MESSFSVLLLAIGVFIAAGILYDVYKRNIVKFNLKTSFIPKFGSKTESKEDPGMNFDELDVDPDISRVSKKEFIIFNLISRHTNGFWGRNLINSFQRCGLVHGDLKIFHYKEATPSGIKTLFSVSSAFEPGYFDLNTIDEFETKGITLFLAIGNRKDTMESFEVMLKVAKQLAVDLDGELQDDKRKTLSVAVIEQCRMRIRAYGEQTAAFETSAV